MSNMTNMPKFALHSNFSGCMLNGHDATLFIEFFRSNGWQQTEDDSEADIIILNSCAFVKNVQDKVVEKLKELRKNKNKKPGQMVVLCGCLPKIDEKTTELADISFGPRENTKFNELIDAKIRIEDIRTGRIDKKFSGNSPSERCYIKISDGCLGNCSFCAIKNAKGTLRSRPRKEIIEEFRKGLKGKGREFVLLGDDIGCYGVDIGTNLAELLREMVEEEGQYSIFLHFVEPIWFIKFFDKLEPVLKSGRIALLNLPIQSGSNRVLELMNRGHKIDDVMNPVKKLKTEFPWLTIQTHILFGFPTETDDDFEQSLKAAEEFDIVKFFGYSDRPGTAAEKTEPKVEGKLKKAMIKKIESAIKKGRKYVLVQI